VSNPGGDAEVFDVFLCHNSEDKPEVREIAQRLAAEDINPWLDQEQIRPGTSWQTVLGQQIETIKSAAVFVGKSGIGPWQNQEMQGLLSQFVNRACPVIPVILSSTDKTPVLPWTLANLHCVDFRARNSDPIKQLIWGITGKKPPAKERLIPENRKSGAARKLSSKTRLYAPLLKSPEPEQAAQLEILRLRVKEYWVDGVLRHSLHNEVLISLGKQQMDKAVDAPWKYTVELPYPADSPTLENRDISTIYDATGSLLILGEPGSGKTTTLLDLARTLLERAENDKNERVPVVLSLSSRKKKQPLVEWISGELSEKYRVPRKIAHLWLRDNYLLPLLDGLDEVPTTLQPDCVTAVNAFIDEFNPAGLAVCCRLNEYRWLPERLKLNGAICLEALSANEVAAYLTTGRGELAALRQAIASDAVLRDLAQTPLMLSIMTLAYWEGGADELVAQKRDSPEERRQRIFRLYVEQMFQRKGTTAPFPKGKTVTWLSWLARKMKEHSESVFLLEGLQPCWLGRRAQRAAFGTIMSLSLGLIFGIIYGLGTEGDELRAGLIAGVSMLFGVGLGCCRNHP
jgi:DNA polymerase III delta prime subunit